MSGESDFFGSRSRHSLRSKMLLGSCEDATCRCGMLDFSASEFHLPRLICCGR
jgi:hypothetical protein